MATDQDSPRHEPVLLQEVLELLTPAADDGIIVDATVGLGGHAEAFLRKYPKARLIGIDRDPEALRRSRERLAQFGERVTLLEGRHEGIIEILEGQKIGAIDALLADLGVSSMQLDDASRGFSFRNDAPLDMRMGRGGQTAADLLAALDERELARILREYGEEPFAKPIARAIVAVRRDQPITTTLQLADVVRRVKRPRPDRIDPATLTFQALRIATNEELLGLGSFVEHAVGMLRNGGRIGVISFHSLEDRIVKATFRKLEGECICPPGLPVCGCGRKRFVEILTGRPVEAGDEEVARNPRARSAKLRIAEKVGE
ncbi:MAG: 16S rRNA (cytosine(1402)-N(4))-methyltransferase RsmH [Thermoanaerobaculia bacterium]